MNVAISLAVSADIPAMQFIRRSVRENRLSDPALIPDSAYQPFIDAASIWVARTPQRIVGFAAIDARAANVWALFVDPDFEGRGIGRRLHETLIDFGRRQNIRRLGLHTQPESRAARFYLHAGWTPAGHAEDGQERFEKDLAT